jgi:SET domain-containing protein
MNKYRMKRISFISDAVFTARSKGMGRGVYTSRSLDKDMIIEIAPVIVMTGQDRKLLDQTLLHDYIFEWGEDRKQCCMALGYVPLYNHSYHSNCAYEMDFRKKTITIKTTRKIKTSEELFINYNGDWDKKTPVWFDAK